MYQGRILQWLAANKLFIESLLASLVVVSVLLNYSGVEGGAEALMISIVALASFHFISAYFIPDLQNLAAIIASKVVGIGCAVSLIGVLFTVSKLAGATNMLFVGSVTLGIAVVVLIVNFAINREWKILPYIIRALIIGSITLDTLLRVLELNA